MPRGRPKKNADETATAAKMSDGKKRYQDVLERKAKSGAAATRAANMKFKTPEELKVACDGYFADCDARNALYGEAGLALWLGISLRTLHSWCDGEYSVELRPVIEEAYLKIQNQVETDPKYLDKALSARAIFLMKQMRLGGKVDKVEAKQDIAVKVHMGDSMDSSDFA